MMKPLVFILTITAGTELSAQFIATPDLKFAAANNPAITIHTPSDLVKKNDYSFGDTHLTIVLNGTTQTIDGTWEAVSLHFIGDGIKHITDNVTVKSGISFEQGIVRPAPAAHFLFVGESSDLQLSESSYVDGVFYQRGTGFRLFPVGTGTAYTPLILEDNQATDEIGVEASDENPMLTVGDVEVGSVSSARYWRIVTNEIAAIRSPVNLSLNGIAEKENLVVVQASELLAAAVSLGSSFTTSENITSDGNISAPVVTIATRATDQVNIREAITPYGSPGVNDRLVVENLNRYDHQKISLVDQWGVVIKTWSEVGATDEVNDDFTQIPPGNYICVVEFHNGSEPVEKISRIVTIVITD